jgi:thermostable 8-oxoguanine DNA glycosylase
MSMPLSERRQIENEMIFRRVNEKVGDELGMLDNMHIEDNNLELIWDDTILLNFKCECSDENCDQRIPLKLSGYKQIHENRNTFIVKLNHQVENIENVIKHEKEYSVVMKNNSTAEPGDKLNVTTVDNS